jgi:hypothetical protein
MTDATPHNLAIAALKADSSMLHRIAAVVRRDPAAVVRARAADADVDDEEGQHVHQVASIWENGGNMPSGP